MINLYTINCQGAHMTVIVPHSQGEGGLNGRLYFIFVFHLKRTSPLCKGGELDMFIQLQRKIIFFPDEEYLPVVPPRVSIHGLYFLCVRGLSGVRGERMDRQTNSQPSQEEEALRLVGSLHIPFYKEVTNQIISWTKWSLKIILSAGLLQSGPDNLPPHYRDKINR